MLWGAAAFLLPLPMGVLYYYRHVTNPCDIQGMGNIVRKKSLALLGHRCQRAENLGLLNHDDNKIIIIIKMNHQICV